MFLQVKVIFAVLKQLKQLQRKPRKKNSEALTWFKPMTSAISVWCSANWSMKPCWKQVKSEFNLYPSYEESEMICIWYKSYKPCFCYCWRQSIFLHVLYIRSVRLLGVSFYVLISVYFFTIHFKIEEGNVAHIYSVIMLQRLDKRKDRVEISPEQLSDASSQAEISFDTQ